jgi:hypothetical protein
MARRSQTAQKPQANHRRLPEDLADDAEAGARVKGTSVSALIIDALKAKIERVHQPRQAAPRTRPRAVGTPRPVTRNVTLA